MGRASSIATTRSTASSIVGNNFLLFLIVFLTDRVDASSAFVATAKASGDAPFGSFAPPSKITAASPCDRTGAGDIITSRMSSSAASTMEGPPRSRTKQGRRLPWRDTNASPLTGIQLRDLAIDAALSEEESCDDALDVPGVAWMEHLNLIVGDRLVAEAFYLDVLGFTADKSKSFHVNLGRQQFHLAVPNRSNGEIPHRIHGTVGLAVPSLETLWERLVAADLDAKSSNEYGLRGTLFDFYVEGDVATTSTAVISDSSVITIRCPWGNVFRCYSASYTRSGSCAGDEDSSVAKPPPSPQKMTNLHGIGGLHGADKMGVLGVGRPGIRFVEFVLPRGVEARAVADFYEATLRCPVTVKEGEDDSAPCCLVAVGPGVHLVFVEPNNPNTNADESDAFGRMEGVHVCIYAHDFRGLYERLRRRSLIWTNPRFRRLDSCDTWEEAKRSRTLRFRHVVDLNNLDDDDPDASVANREVLFDLEHETRPLRHGQFMKAPHYEPK